MKKNNYYFLRSIVILLCWVMFSHRVEAEGWQLPLTEKVIVIDPGHGGIDGGATRGNVMEKDVTLIISKMLRDYLQPLGATVVLTREGDYDLAEKNEKIRVRRRKALDLSRRVQLVNDCQPDLFISIHLNAIPHTATRGAQTFYFDSFKENRQLAKAVQEELIDGLKNTTRQARPIYHVYLLKHIKVPAALVEVGFVSNANERALLSQELYQRKIATAIYNGILNYYSD
ncbi:MAG: N-acetylmuramoyl-L-alanine amidase CwlD [Bacilli bacterium]